VSRAAGVARDDEENRNIKSKVAGMMSNFFCLVLLRFVGLLLNEGNVGPIILRKRRMNEKKG